MSPDIPARPGSDPYEDPIAKALVDVVVERGYEAASVEEVVERAGVSRAEFDRRFDGKEDCVRAVFDAFATEFERRVGLAYAAHHDWRTGLRAAAYECAHWMTENPKLVHFGAVELLAAESEMIRVRREQAFAFAAGLIDAGRAGARDPEAISDSTAVMAIGSIVQLLIHRLQSGAEIGEPRRLIPELMYVAVRPYVGEEVAREELTMPPPGDEDPDPPIEGVPG
jgi:AcrR family transcriptional regulator